MAYLIEVFYYAASSKIVARKKSLKWNLLGNNVKNILLLVGFFREKALKWGRLRRRRRRRRRRRGESGAFPSLSFQTDSKCQKKTEVASSPFIHYFLQLFPSGRNSVRSPLTSRYLFPFASNVWKNLLIFLEFQVVCLADREGGNQNCWQLAYLNLKQDTKSFILSPPSSVGPFLFFFPRNLPQFLTDRRDERKMPPPHPPTSISKSRERAAPWNGNRKVIDDAIVRRLKNPK